METSKYYKKEFININQSIEFTSKSVRIKTKKRFIWLFILLFFLPYYPGTSFRIDQFLGITYILAIPCLLFTKKVLKFESKPEMILTLIAFLVVIYTFLRVLADFSIPLRIINYQLYLACGMGIWYVHHNTFTAGKNIFIKSLLVISIPISLFAVFQFYFKDSALTHFLLTWYNGEGSEDYEITANGMHETYNNLAAIEVLTGTSMTSIFTGKHSLAMFCMFIISLGLGAKHDDSMTSRSKNIAIAAILAAIIAGFFSTSKIFFFGIIIMFGLYYFCNLSKDTIFAVIAKILLVVFFSITAIVLGDELRVLGNIINTVLSGDVLNIFSSRFGSDGYLSQYASVLNQPITWIAGLGAQAGAMKISDNQFRSILLIGGLPYFFLFFSFIIYLLILNWRSRFHSPYSLPFFSLGIALLFSSLGIEVYWQARTVPLWILANVLLAIPKSAGTRIPLHYRKVDRTGDCTKIDFSAPRGGVLEAKFRRGGRPKGRGIYLP